MCRKIILSCSKKKTTTLGIIPAIDRYDGIAFRLLRRYQQKSSEKFEIYIISAEFGLISHLERIPFYERKMCDLRAWQLKEQIANQAKKTFLRNFDSENNCVFINLGSTYLNAFDEVVSLIRPKSNITVASGSSGKRLSVMYDWLYGVNSPLRQEDARNRKSKTVNLKGIEIKLNKSQIYSLARKQMLKPDYTAFDFQTWYVSIDNKKISPKWLVSQITDLPVKDFHSDQARKVLQKLGMKVQRI